MASIDTLFKITASVTGTDAVKQLSAEVTKVSTAGENMSRAFARAGTAVKAFITAAAVRELSGFVKHQIDLADNLNDISQRTGVAVSELAKYKVAADNSGTSIEELAGTLAKLNKNIVAAQDGTGRQAGAFRALGISIRDASGKIKGTDEILLSVADKFQRFPDGAIKSALAMELFGKSGANLIPFLNQGREGIEQFGLAIDQEFASAADTFNDKLGILGAKMQGFGISAAKALLPAMNQIVDSFTSLFDKEDDMKGFFEDVGIGLKAISTLALGLVGALRFMVSTIQALIESAALLKNKTSSLITGVDFTQGKTFENIMADYNNRNSENLSNVGKSVDIMWGSPQAKAANDNSPRSGAIPNFSPLNDTAEKQAASNRDALEKWVVKQKEAITTLKQEAEYIGKTKNEIDQLKEARRLDAEFTEKTVGMSPKVVEEYRKQQAEIKAQTLAVMQLNYEQSRTFSTGARNFFAEYAENATNAAAAAKGAFENAFKGMEDALVEFTKTGKLNFRSLATSIIDDLIRIQVRQSILGPLAGLFGSFAGSFAGGNSFSQSVGFATQGGMGPFPAAFASGGDHMGGLRIVGENGPELEATGPSRIFNAAQTRQILGGAGGGNTNIAVTVNMGSNDNVQGGDGKGQAIGKAIAAAVRSTIIDEKRPGGLLAG